MAFRIWAGPSFCLHHAAEVSLKLINLRMSSAESRRFVQMAQHDHREASRYRCEACNSLGVRGSDAQITTLEDDHEPWNDRESITPKFATTQVHGNECCTCECVSFAVIYQPYNTANHVQKLLCFHVFKVYLCCYLAFHMSREKTCSVQNQLALLASFFSQFMAHRFFDS